MRCEHDLRGECRSGCVQAAAAAADAAPPGWPAGMAVEERMHVAAVTFGLSYTLMMRDAPRVLRSLALRGVFPLMRHFEVSPASSVALARLRVRRRQLPKADKYQRCWAPGQWSTTSVVRPSPFCVPPFAYPCIADTVSQSVRFTSYRRRAPL